MSIILNWNPPKLLGSQFCGCRGFANFGPKIILVVRIAAEKTTFNPKEFSRIGLILVNINIFSTHTDAIK